MVLGSTQPLTETSKSKGVPRQAEVALGVPDRLRPQIISMFRTTRVVGRRPYALAAFTPIEIPGTHFQNMSRPQGTWFCRKEPRKKIPSDTTGVRSRHRPTSSAANRNEYQEYFLGDNGGRCVKLTTLPPPCTDFHEMWEREPAAIHRACPDLNRNSCTFTFTLPVR